MDRNEIRKEVNINPSQAQCEAGNYKMGHIRVQGFDISIENPKGSYRKGKDKNGKEWKTLMNNDYGYFRKTVGKDGDAIDVFLGPNLKSQKVYPIDQYINGEFDETKVMLGFNSEKEAKSAYLSNYEKNWKGFKYITEVDIETFKKWLYDGYRQRKPFALYKELCEDKINIGNLLLEETGEDLINEALDVVHCRGDLSSTFIENGKYACSQISNGKYYGPMEEGKKFNSVNAAFKTAHRDRDGRVQMLKGSQVHKSPKDYDRKKSKQEVKKEIRNIDESMLAKIISEAILKILFK